MITNVLEISVKHNVAQILYAQHKRGGKEKKRLGSVSMIKELDKRKSFKATDRIDLQCRISV